MKTKIIIYLVLLFGCKTLENTKRVDEVNFESLKLHMANNDIDSFNIGALYRYRDALFSKLPPSIMQNDTIIFLEYFTFFNIDYDCTIYESNENKILKYNGKSNNLDTITYSKDFILNMAKEGKFAEIKQKGDNTNYSPQICLIMNAIIRDSEKKEFNFTTVITNSFYK